jgi:hypothetical protein
MAITIRLPVFPGRSASRRGLFRLAGATAIAAAMAGAACTEDKHTQGRAAAAPVPTQGASGGTSSQRQTFPDDPRVRMQHLLRRAGFAPSDAEVRHALDLGPDATLDALLNPEKTPDGLPAALQSFDPGNQPRPQDLAAWWMGRMTATATPSLEKMTLLWHGWHTSGFDKLGPRGTPLMYQQNVFQRANAFGRFGDILKGISRQPAMMIYLDTATNVKGHPNENFSRELMELFSMGVGNYTESDVREGARAFTGYSIDRQAGTFVFRPRLHDDGAKTFLGQTGNFSGDDVIDIIMQQPATPAFVARKVWSFFVYPGPDDGTLAPVVKAFTESGGDMRAVMRAVFTHPEFTSGRAYRALVKSPVEYEIGAVRQLGLTPPDLEAVRWAQQMGQIPFYPPNVAGWPGGAAWMGSGSFFGRLNGVNRLLFGAPAPRPGQGGNGNGQANAANPPNGQGTGQAVGGLDADQYLDQHKIASAGDLVDHLLTLLVDGQAAADERATLVDYASGGRGEGASLASLSQNERTERVRGTAYLIMSGPAYQLA